MKDKANRPGLSASPNTIYKVHRAWLARESDADKHYKDSIGISDRPKAYSGRSSNLYARENISLGKDHVSMIYITSSVMACLPSSSSQRLNIWIRRAYVI